MKRVQVFVHKNYESIKLVLLVIIFLMAFVTITHQIQKNNQDAIDRAEAVESVLDADRQIIDAIKNETNEQTVIINRQFRALCILIIETSGQEGLQKLDPDSRARCEQLAEDTEFIEDGTTRGNSLGTRDSRQRPLGSQSASSSNNTPPSQTPQHENPQNPPSNPEPPKQQSIIPLVDEPVIGCLTGRLCL